MDKIEKLEKEGVAKEIPDFKVGDTVRVIVRIPEGDKFRLHPFEGTVIARNGSRSRASFTVRKISFGEGVERVFPLYSPIIEEIQVLHRGKVRRAKLYYLRQKIGKQTRVETEEAQAKTQETVQAETTTE